MVHLGLVVVQVVGLPQQLLQLALLLQLLQLKAKCGTIQLMVLCLLEPAQFGLSLSLLWPVLPVLPGLRVLLLIHCLLVI
jgi:hypothetical protein